MRVARSSPATACRCKGFCPCERLAALGIRIVEADTAGGELGWYEPETWQVVVRPDLSRGMRRATLAHELVHVERRERRLPSSSWWAGKDGEWNEYDVDEIAARQLLPLAELVDVLLTALTVDDVADALDVDPATIHARVRTFTPAERRYVDRRCFIASQQQLTEGERP